MCTTDTLRTSSHPQQPTMPVHALFKRTFDQEANKLYSPVQIFVISRKKKQKCNENFVAYCSRVLSVYRHLGQAFKTQMVRDCSQPQFYSFPDWYIVLVLVPMVQVALLPMLNTAANTIQATLYSFKLQKKWTIFP